MSPDQDQTIAEYLESLRTITREMSVIKERCVKDEERLAAILFQLQTYRKKAEEDPNKEIVEPDHLTILTRLHDLTCDIEARIVRLSGELDSYTPEMNHLGGIRTEKQDNKVPLYLFHPHIPELLRLIDHYSAFTFFAILPILSLAQISDTIQAETRGIVLLAAPGEDEKKAMLEAIRERNTQMPIILITPEPVSSSEPLPCGCSGQIPAYAPLKDLLNACLTGLAEMTGGSPIRVFPSDPGT